MASGRNAFASPDPSSRSLLDRRHSSDQSRTSQPTLSRSSSNASGTSRKSEPGWLTAMNGVDRSRAGSAPENSSGKSPSGFSKLFGKKKEKKDTEHNIITSKHAAAVKTKLALDPKFKDVRRGSAPAYVSSATQNNLLISAGAQEMRHPHSGPPALYSLKEKAGLPMLTRIISGDEADELDEWEKMRDEWKQRKIPTLDDNIIEGVAVGGRDSGQSTPEDQDGKTIEIPPSEVVERQGVRMLSVAGMTADEYSPRPSRTHTPIGGRWKKDEKGVWKR
ncbi:hypothetical protein G647_02036 [Cladophialophora carrionii CBS 160.54]|uniref:Uncharacterized protein n=1 Tax=Cladophialophora carrionii CBS 160.54 TaxID=1279043 RepID=V9DTC6_9EURO|nr:uncharacterized protein G647_02036 [Cladophialophora carrionii CBS 160.54]ETI29583.1 hypothetical protein G647_02036 [Cladophialophora carrionii CBS 160.54]